VRPRAAPALGVTTEGWGQRWSVAGTQEGSGASPVFAGNPWKLAETGGIQIPYLRIWGC